MIIAGICYKNENRIHLDGQYLDPGPSQKLRNHSPTGFNWGYGGSGPAQLALAILLDHFGENIAQEYYQAFKWQFVATWPMGKPFEVEIDLDGWIFSQQKYQADRYASRYDFDLGVDI
jgi:hypothetical protein